MAEMSQSHPTPVTPHSHSGTHNQMADTSSSEAPNTAGYLRPNRAHKSRQRPVKVHSPAKLGFYSPRSKSILKDAKRGYRLFIATKVAFPTTAQAFEHGVITYNISADDYAAETGSEREDIPVPDTGRLQVVYFCVHICVSLWNSTSQTYNVGATMRGDLKTHGRTIILREYNIMPPNADELSEKEKRKAIKDNVTPLLTKGTWAHAPAAKEFHICLSTWLLLC
jgi:hypothetical protein